jgi:hypothetical protein
MVDPISNHDPSSLTTQKKCNVRKSLIAMTTMKRADGATPNLLFKIPRFAEIKANGIISFKIKRPPCEKGSKTGIIRLTLSRLKEEMEAMLPVLKKADWRSVRKNKEIRASVKVSERNGEEDKDAGTSGTLVPLFFAEVIEYV